MAILRLFMAIGVAHSNLKMEQSVQENWRFFSNELGISKEHTEEIMNELKEQRDVRFYISDDYATRYSFEIQWI